MLPRIASGPIAKTKEAETNPSTKLDSSFLSNLDLSFSPKTSKDSSIFSQLPIAAPINREKTTTRIAPPWGNAWVKLTSQ